MADTHDESNAPQPRPQADPAAETPNRRRALRYEFQDDVPHTAAARSTPERLARALEHAMLCARIADDNRARDIKLLDIRSATPLVDYFVILTAPTRRQNNAIAIEIDQEMKKLDEKKIGIEGSEEGRWTLMDYGDFIVHIFSDEARSYYSLEEIWGDATEIEWRDAERLERARAKAAGKAADAAADQADDEAEPDADAGT